MRTPKIGRSAGRRKTLLLFGVLMIGVSMAGCGGATGAAEPSGTATPSDGHYPVTLQNCGVSVTIKERPARAITMNQGATETLLSLGWADRMVGTAYLDDTVSSRWQKDYASVPVLAKEYPNQETILGKSPDLITASYGSAFGAKAAGSRAELASLGIATYVSPFGCEDKSQRPAPSWDAIFAEVRDIAKIGDQREEGEQLISQQRKEISEITAAAPAKEQKIFWYDSGTKQPFVGAGDGAPQLIMDALGAQNVFAALDGTWADGSWEEVLSIDPDLIVLADASWDTAEQKKAYLKKDPALKDLQAVRNDAFLVVPFSTTTPGIRNAEGLAGLAAQLSSLR